MSPVWIMRRQGGPSSQLTTHLLNKIHLTHPINLPEICYQMSLCRRCKSQVQTSQAYTVVSKIHYKTRSLIAWCQWYAWYFKYVILCNVLLWCTKGRFTLRWRSPPIMNSREFQNLIGQEQHSCPVVVHTTAKSPLVENIHY